jgi:type IV pilus assembly protein PilN
MIKINLSPSPKKAKAPKAKAAKPSAGIKLPSIQASAIYIAGIAIVVIVIAVTLLLQTANMGQKNSEIRSLKSKLEELKVYVQTVDSLKKREAELMSLINPIKKLNKDRFVIAHVLDEISTRIPEFTWLTTLDIDTERIGIKGTTASNLLVADFMNRLEESPYIRNVDLTVLEKKTIEKQEMMEFTLTANVTSDTMAGRQK